MIFYSTSKTLSLGPVSDFALRGSALNGFAGKDCELFWSTGVLEYWSVGKSESPHFNLNWFFSLLHYSTTPSLQQTAASGKEYRGPLRGSPKLGPWGRILYYTSLFRREKSWSTLCCALLYSAREVNLESRHANTRSVTAGDFCPSMA